MTDQENMEFFEALDMLSEEDGFLWDDYVKG